MILEPQTLLVASLSTLALVAGVALLVWSRDRHEKAILWTVAASLLGGASTLMREMLPSTPAIVLANITLLTGASCLATACRTLGHRSPAWRGLALPVLVWLLGCSVPAFMADQQARVALSSLLCGLVMAWALAELWQDSREALRSRRFLQGVLGLQGLASFIRAGMAVWSIDAGPSAGILRTGALPFVTLWTFGFALLSSLGVILFVRERVELRLQQAADQDGLTGLTNRRRFEQVLEALVAEARHSRRTIALLMVDADAFKLYNDRYGHLAGDGALQQIAGTLANVAGRAKGLAARYGGEEFAVLLPGAGEAASVQLAEAMRAGVYGLAIAHDDWHHGRVTISIGLASCIPGVTVSARGLLLAADQALYVAKRAGRNQVQLWQNHGTAVENAPQEGDAPGAPIWVEPAHGALACHPPTA